ncbi:helix-turn-helix domain-containing protein [Psychrobacter sp.]|uniref:helix-turn-helix domain-containing protein n=1 Tax=Psychrobacter sp. TaxID=56811 RepID=UPI0025CBD357|nr:helix-turn-helix domain-containing protein [Psychrobacter sp.]
MEIDRKDPLTQTLDTSNQTFGSFGNQLKQARISQNLTLDDVAAELFILRRHLEAIEAEDFTSLPQAAFARGFVINYAKFLGLDSDQVVDSFNRNYPDALKKKSVDDIESPLKPMGTLQREGRRAIRFNPLLLLGLIGLIILAVFLIRTISNAKDASQEKQPNTGVVDNISDSEQSAGAAVKTTVVDSGNNLGSSGSALNLDSTAAATATGEDATLDFWVQGNSPITVIDATGKTLISGEQSRGSYKLAGKTPFKVQIGNVSNVTLNLNGEPIKLSEFAQNNQANFSLAP